MAERSLAAYLVLPRPDEARAKAPMALLAFGLVHVADVSGDRVPVATALVAWAVFELLLYQSRYMLNDLADADVDRLHVAAEARARLPAGARARRWAMGVVAGRVLLAAAIVALLPDPARGITFLAALGLVAATASYEAARAPMRRAHPCPRPKLRSKARLYRAFERNLGRPGPAPGAELPRAGVAGLAVGGLVGAGYAVRVGLGAALGGARGTDVVAAIVFGWLFGTVGVVMAWTLEAAGLRSGGDTRVMARKAHIAGIARLVGDDPAHLQHPLLVGGGARLTAALLTASSVAAVALGVALGGSPDTVRLVGLLVGCAVVGPVLQLAWTSPWAGAVAVGTALATAATLGTADGRDELLLLFAVVASTVAVARTFSPETIDLNPTAGTPDAPPAVPDGASPGATTARPVPARGHDEAAARSLPGSGQAARR